MLAAALLLCSLPVYAQTQTGGLTTRIVFTHDIHSFIDKAPKLNTVLSAERAASADGSLVYLDGGDFSQGTLYQTGYEDRALELGMLAALGCRAACIGNHEWDHAGRGFAAMLGSAMKYYSQLPPLLCANLDFSGDLSPEQQTVRSAMEEYNSLAGAEGTSYTVIEAENGMRLGLFGLSGESSIEDSPTSGMKWTDQAEAAKKAVSALSGRCDVIIALSHSGSDGNGQGEDAELAKAVPGIDMILSGHTHSVYTQPCMVGDTLIASAGCYLSAAGCVDVSVAPDGSVSFSGYRIIPLDDGVADDADIKALLEDYNSFIDGSYLAPYRLRADQLLAHCGFDFMSLDDMYASHQEYPLGNLIADSYLYEARKNGIDDIDVALVGLGTIRGSFTEGDISVSDAFEICSLGAGEDGSAGHPLLTAYITGRELKLLTELDASLGPMVSSIKMSYSGLEYSFNTKRMLLDRVTELHLVRADGSMEDIEDGRLYKVCCNMYAANMLGMLNGLTKGILSIVPKYADGSPVQDFYSCALSDLEGRELKEWFAFADYLSSFDKGEGELPEIPEMYKDAAGRKVKYAEGGLAIIAHPGAATLLAAGAALLILLLLTVSVKLVKKHTGKKADK